MGIKTESKHFKDELLNFHLKEKVKLFVENSLRKIHTYHKYNT